MKKCSILHWSLAIIGVILLVFFIIGTYISNDFLGVKNSIFFLHSANSFLLLCIVSKLLCGCNCKNDAEKKA